MDKTTNYDLGKPLVSENYDIGVFNANAGVLNGIPENQCFVTTGVGSAYLGAVEGLLRYYNGLRIIINPNVNSLANATLNINAYGAVALKNNTGASLVAGELLSGRLYEFIYFGGVFNQMSSGTVILSGTGEPPTLLPGQFYAKYSV